MSATDADAPPLSRRPAWAEVDLDAVAHNVLLLADAAGGAALCAVVKADGYGHGAVPVARTALAAGATWLAVALPAEAKPLRDAGIDAPILVLSEAGPAEVEDVVTLDLRPTVYSHESIAVLSEAAMAAGSPSRVHLKVDTGMHRVGAAVDDVPALALAVLDSPGLELEAAWTHCAVADEPGNVFTAEQCRRFDAVLADLETAGVPVPMVHAANSAATIDSPQLRRDLVRCGIAVYGLAPSPAMEGRLDLRPAMRLVARVSWVKVVQAGEAVSYGLRHRFEEDTVVATLPVGYADGVPRRLFEVGGEVVIGGRRRPVVGAVTMDQLMVSCGPAGDPHADAVARGDEAVLIGRQGQERIGAEEWAARLGTISYEIVCGISSRVPRRYRGGS